nr:hypothetical protein [Candidatus Freyarchaeota archaeon]
MTSTAPKMMYSARCQSGRFVLDTPEVIPNTPLINRPMPSNIIKIEIPVKGNIITNIAIKIDNKPNTRSKPRRQEGSVLPPAPTIIPANPMNISAKENRKIMKATAKL